MAVTSTARLYYHDESGRLLVPEAVHHLPSLLLMSPEAILDAFRASQQEDFTAMLAGLARPDTDLGAVMAELRALAGPDNPFRRTPVGQEDPEQLRALFLDLHDHVMAHPVWRHPFFLRLFAGPLTEDQIQRFAVAYFNQVKNTRQCVALATGRFHGLMVLPYGNALNERVSELTQTVLGQLLADEYGVTTHDIDAYPGLGALLRARTHPTMYRQLFAGLGVPVAAQDVPLRPGVADNVLTQRMLASDPRFSPLEALASVGLGMEWGVPEFFSLILGGLIRHAAATHTPLTPEHLEVFIAHVKYDVLHAVAVMLVTALHMPEGAADTARVKQAVNALMAARYGMMTDLMAAVFEEAAPTPVEAGFASEHRLADPRFDAALRAARTQIAPGTVVAAPDWPESPTPFPV